MVITALAVGGCSHAAAEPRSAVIVVEGSSCPILQPLHFEHEGTTVADSDGALVQATAATMREHPDVVLLEVAGHASDREGAAAEISRRRAEATVAALVAAGVDPRRLRGRAYGARCPLSREPGDEHVNRRAEFRVAMTTSGPTGAMLGCAPEE